MDCTVSLKVYNPGKNLKCSMSDSQIGLMNQQSKRYFNWILGVLYLFSNQDPSFENDFEFVNYTLDTEFRLDKKTMVEKKLTSRINLKFSRASEDGNNILVVCSFGKDFRYNIPNGSPGSNNPISASKIPETLKLGFCQHWSKQKLFTKEYGVKDFEKLIEKQSTNFKNWPTYMKTAFCNEIYKKLEKLLKNKDAVQLISKKIVTNSTKPWYHLKHHKSTLGGNLDGYETKNSPASSNKNSSAASSNKNGTSGEMGSFKNNNFKDVQVQVLNGKKMNNKGQQNNRDKEKSNGQNNGKGKN